MANSGLRRDTPVDLSQDADTPLEYDSQAGCPVSVSKGQHYDPRNPLDRFAPPAAKELPSLFSKVLAAGTGKK